MGDGEPTISFRDGRRADIKELAEDMGESVSNVYRAFNDLLLEDELFNQYFQAHMNEDYDFSEFLEDEFDMEYTEPEINEEVLEKAVEELVEGYVLGNREKFLDGMAYIDDEVGAYIDFDLDEYAAEKLDSIHQRTA